MSTEEVRRLPRSAPHTVLAGAAQRMRSYVAQIPRSPERACAPLLDRSSTRFGHTRRDSGERLFRKNLPRFVPVPERRSNKHLR